MQPDSHTRTTDPYRHHPGLRGKIEDPLTDLILANNLQANSIIKVRAKRGEPTFEVVSTGRSMAGSA